MGPIAVVWHPENLSLQIRGLISLKTINIMIGEETPRTKSLAILPFPSLNLKGLVKFMELRDKSKRGGVIESSLTLLYDEGYDSIFYKYLSHFEDIFDTTIDKIIKIEETTKDKKQILKELEDFFSKATRTLEDLQSEEIATEEQFAFPTIDQKEPHKDRLRFKIIVCGDPMVGKTSLILRFTDRAFRRTYISTIGVNITEKSIDYKNADIELIIWDIAGQIKFQQMRKHFYKGADALFLVFDLTSLETFKNIRKWNIDINNFLRSKIPGILLGNKSDLVDREISRKDGESMANELGYSYIETSALEGENVDEAFFKISKILYDMEKEKSKRF